MCTVLIAGSIYSMQVQALFVHDSQASRDPLLTSGKVRKPRPWLWVACPDWHTAAPGAGASDRIRVLEAKRTRAQRAHGHQGRPSPAYLHLLILQCQVVQAGPPHDAHDAAPVDHRCMLPRGPGDGSPGFCAGVGYLVRIPAFGCTRQGQQATDKSTATALVEAGGVDFKLE